MELVVRGNHLSVLTDLPDGETAESVYSLVDGKPTDLAKETRTVANDETTYHLGIVIRDGSGYGVAWQ